MEKPIYVQPEIEVIEIEVEKGFATSGAPGSTPGGNSPVNPW